MLSSVNNTDKPDITRATFLGLYLQIWFLSAPIGLYKFVFICMHVCVYVCMRERERGREVPICICEPVVI